MRATPAEWDIVHAFGTSVEGWLVLVARRHITCMAEMTDGEAASLGPLIREVSRALHAVLGCEKTYVVQFAEHPDHPHVHVHVIARARDLPFEWRGPGIFGRTRSNADESVSTERMDDIAARVSAELRIWRKCPCVNSTKGRRRFGSWSEGRAGVGVLGFGS